MREKDSIGVEYGSNWCILDLWRLFGTYESSKFGILDKLCLIKHKSYNAEVHPKKWVKASNLKANYKQLQSNLL